MVPNLRAGTATVSAFLPRIPDLEMTIRDVLFGGTRTDPPPVDLAMLLLRAFTGLALALAHGMGKLPPSARFVARVGDMGMPAPEAFAWMSAFAEFGCGLLLAVGLLTRPAALMVAGNMAIVVLLAHAGDPFGPREKPLFFLVVALVFLARGAGRVSLDALLRGRARTPDWRA